ncbi:hypothetical protein DY000_02002421 [Brassica cretica]|uniref:Protein kinase domain-containing protein n=1 Tax=Brassica cretica TaxID=69181 RepID=A0ABQ7BZL4_BRACR|nr:hypothetical protein DY000_02002421 [Brassica cretica]
MYVGFSASTGLVGAMHYMWSWFFTFDLNVHELDFPIPTFPPYPNPKSQVKRTVMATFLTILLFIGLVASALSIFFYKKHKMVKEVLEEWEIQCGPHRFSYKELFKATKGFSDKQLLGKGGNVLIDHHMDARLGDFGLAKLYDQGFDPHTSRVIGTIGYIAPELIRSGRATTGTDVYAFGLFMLEVSCGRRLIEPRAPSNEAVLAEWTLECWESGDILEAASETLRAEQDREQVKLVLKLGVLCSHQVATIRPDMSKVIKILNGDVQLPDNLLDIVKAEKIRVWSEISERALGVLNTQMSIGTLTLTEPFTSHGR